ncbi:uncharacterized protein [Palaemon carinicauda]|uniref:uncharacterized protein n=1 Tax=Palaemon carinicauda TaxID=392227 RepID=UPI0035B61217
MDNASDSCETNIPKEIKTSVIASTEFFKVLNPLEQLSGKSPLRKNVMAVTNQGYMMELQGGEVLRFNKLKNWDVKKIIVHHEFHPLQLYIVFVCHNHIAYAASYSDLKIIHQWPDIENIISDDPDDIGLPSLRLTHLSGKTSVITSLQLSSPCPFLNSGDDEVPETERGKKDAVSALAHRLKGGMKHVEFLNCQRKMKEAMVVKKLATIQSQLGGQNLAEEDETLVTTINISDGEDEEDLDQQLPEAITSDVSLEIVSVRHKVIHDKWVIGLNVINNSERILICNMQLMLHILKGTSSMAYTTKILKVIQRRLPGVDQSDSNIKVSVENLDPPILRPKKRACILGICGIPDFMEGSTIVCSGIVNYTSKTLNPAETQGLFPVKSTSQHFQVVFEPVELQIQDLHSHHVVIEKNLAQAGVPFSSVALIGGSTYNSITITSLISPLDNLVKRINSEHEMVKVYGVSDMYCFYPEKCHPLAFSAVTLQIVNSHHVDLGLYTRDDSQAIILAHSLLAALPPDVCIQPTLSHNQNHHKDSKNIRPQLLAKMKEATNFVVDGYESKVETLKNGSVHKTGQQSNKPAHRESSQNETVSDEDVFNRETYSKKREMFLARRQDVTFKPDEYREWRRKLYKIQSEMDELYIRYLK